MENQEYNMNAGVPTALNTVMLPMRVICELNGGEVGSRRLGNAGAELTINQQRLGDHHKCWRTRE